jgi:hypothetical protein
VGDSTGAVGARILAVHPVRIKPPLATRQGRWAAAQAPIAAPALGLGTTFAGSLAAARQGDPPWTGRLGVPEGEVPRGASVLGDPPETCPRIPVRGLFDVTWR